MERLKRSQLFVFGETITAELIKAGIDFADQLADFEMLKLPFYEVVFQIGPLEIDDTLAEYAGQLEYWIIQAWQDGDDICGRHYICDEYNGNTSRETYRLKPGVNRSTFIHSKEEDTVLPDVSPAESGENLHLPEPEPHYIKRFWCSLLFGCLGCLHGKGIDVNEVKEPKFTNRKREAKGKAPLFGFRWLTVDPSLLRIPGNSIGEGHAPPRLHWRRGHVRRLSSGRITMVRPCLVGDVSNGVIEKGYFAKTNCDPIKSTSTR
ncbi:hypothetical protein DSM110277_02056 [Sulfitobacter pontiacus]|uniref:Uncharacterized protein n=2 Tax=Sulfitobacter pontiacus TaxID=60137 RepID=A0AAX3ABK9_9RHOB|nr:hypothetical protein DSM110277_02056 [Sulfitobacter pontiacus]